MNSPKKLTLYELTAQYQQLLEMALSEETLSDELIEALEEKEMDFEEKIFSYTAILKELYARQEGFKKAIESLEARAASAIKSIKYFEGRIKESMQKCQKNKLSNEFHDVKLILNNPKVDYIDKNLVPEQFIRHQIKEIIEPATSEILKFLKEGNEIPGARLVRETRLAIR